MPQGGFEHSKGILIFMMALILVAAVLIGATAGYFVSLDNQVLLFSLCWHWSPLSRWHRSFCTENSFSRIIAAWRTPTWNCI